jgi:hypothetical protein
MCVASPFSVYRFTPSSAPHAIISRRVEPRRRPPFADDLDPEASRT